MKNNDQKKAQDDIRKQLEDMLLGSSPISDESVKDSPVANDGDQNPLGKAQHPGTKSMEFYKVKDEVEQESKKLLKGVIDFYLDAKIIKKNEYIKYKRAVDEMSLSNIVFSLKSTQHAIIKLLEEIDMGNIHPRIFEVLAQLQAQMMVIVKHQAAFMITLEEGYKKIRDDHEKTEYLKSLDSQKEGSDKIEMTDDGKKKVRGTKNLMLEIKKMNEEKIEDVKYEEVEKKPRLTDPLNRPQSSSANMEENTNGFDDDIGFNIDDDMF